MGLDNPVHLAFIVVILLLVFGARRLPEIGRSLGSGMREFKDSISGEAKHQTLSSAIQQPQPVAQQPVAQAFAQQPVAQQPQPFAQQPVAQPAPPVTQQPVVQPVAQPSAVQPQAAPTQPPAAPAQPAAPEAPMEPQGSTPPAG
jgi:sec-independent protein translocase protein TatA